MGEAKAARRAAQLSKALLAGPLLACTMQVALAQNAPPYVPGPLPGLATELPASGESDPTTFDQAAQIAGEARATIDRGLRSACIDPDLLKDLVGRAQRALYQLTVYHDADTSREYQVGIWAAWINTELLKLEKKKKCLEPAETPAQPQINATTGAKPISPARQKLIDSYYEDYKGCLTKAEIARLLDLEDQKMFLSSDLENLFRAQDFLNSGQNLHDYIQEKMHDSYNSMSLYNHDDPQSEHEVEDFWTEQINKWADKIRANPDIIKETQSKLDGVNAELDGLKKKCPAKSGNDETGFNPGGGFYLGFSSGIAVASSSVSWSPNFGPVDSSLVSRATGTTVSAPGMTFGGQVGFDFMTGYGVTLGAVGDLNVKTASQTRAISYASPFGGLFPISQSFNSSFEITFRARAGIVLPVSPGLSIMPYVTGGGALAQIKTSDAMYFPTSFNTASSSQFRSGWTVGGGLGIMPTASPIRFQLEYLFDDFGTSIYFAPNSAFPTSVIRTSHRITQHRGTIAVNVPFEAIPGLFAH
jgi:opacity protein-like surface antigen